MADLLTEAEFTTGESITGFIPMLGGDKVLMCGDLNAVVLQLPSLARIDITPAAGRPARISEAMIFIGWSMWVKKLYHPAHR